MAEPKVQTGLRINEEMYLKLRFLCTCQKRSMNNLIEHILQDYIQNYEETHGSIETKKD